MCIPKENNERMMQPIVVVVNLSSYMKMAVSSRAFYMFFQGGQLKSQNKASVVNYIKMCNK